MTKLGTYNLSVPGVARHAVHRVDGSNAMGLSILYTASGLMYWGGTEMQILKLCVGMRARGHRVSLACIPNSRLDSLARRDGIETLSLRTRSEYDWRRLPAFFSLFRSRRYDVVHVYTPEDRVVPTAAGRLAGVSAVIMHRGMQDGFANPMTAFAACYLFCDALIAVSEAVRSQILQQGVSANRVFRVYNGIGIPPLSCPRSSVRQELHLPVGTFLVAAVGRLVKEKGFDLLIRAMRQVIDSKVDAHCVIVGPGPEEGSLRHLADSLGLGDSVHFLGFRDDVVAILAEAQLCAMPSRTEGFGNVALEALSVGCPVVASDVGGLPEVVGEACGVLVPPENPEKLARAIVNLAANPALLREMRAAGRRRAEQMFSLEAMLDGVENVYYEVLRRKGRLATPNLT